MNKRYSSHILLAGAGALWSSKGLVFRFVSSLLVLGSTSQGLAQGTVNGVPISTAADSQFFPTIIGNGAGGAIIAWEDHRSPDSDIYVQHIDAAGGVQWTSDGVPVLTGADRQLSPSIASDGNGGAIITWLDLRGAGPDIYAQRIDPFGVIQWTVDGVPISAASNFQEQPVIVSDGSGGAIIAWRDLRSGNWDIYAQAVNAAGVVQWTADGVPISMATNDQTSPVILSDGAGGAIIVWEDNRTGSWDIYAQLVDVTGVAQWTGDGVAISIAANDQVHPSIASDGVGGAIIAWEDLRAGNDDVYAQLVDASGVVQWTADGVPISTGPNDESAPVLVTDNVGGAIIAWDDERSGNDDIYVQRIDATSGMQWAADGVPISTATNDQTSPVILSDGASGAIIVWEDNRSGNWDLYAQRVNATGLVEWTADGLAISTGTQSQERPEVVSDEAGEQS